MQKVTRLIPLFLGLLLLLSSCSSNPDHSRYISRDAVGVIGINTSELAKKVAWNMLSGSPMFKEMTQNAGGDTSALDIEKTGIEPLTTFFAYGLPDQRFSGKSKFVVIIPLKDPVKFKAFVAEKFPQAKFETKDKLTLAMLNGNTSIGWDKNTAIAVAAPSTYEWQEDGAAPDNSTLLSEEVQKTFALTREQSLAGNAKFRDLQKAGHDISFWLNYEMLASSMPQEEIGTAGAIMASQKKLLKDAYVAGGVDFEKGRIKGDATYYFNPSVKPIAEAMEVKTVNNDLLKKVPGQQMNLLLSYHFNPQGIKALVDTMGMAPLANAGLKEAGLSLDEVLNVFTGDFLLAVTDFSVTTESQSYNMGGSSMSYTKPVPHFKASLSFRVKDKAALDKLLQLGLNSQTFTASAVPVQGTAFTAGPVTIAVNNEYVVISNDAEVAGAFLAATGSSFNIPSEVKNNPYGFFADIRNSVKNLPLDLLYGKEDTAVFHDAKNLMESVTAYGGKVSGDHVDFHFEALFQNKNENSLLQLIRFAQKVAEAEKKEGDSFEEVVPEEAADTTAI